MADQAVSTRHTTTLLAAAQQFQRLLAALAIVGLSLTGLPQRFAVQAWAETLMLVFGGIESTRILHRFFALLLLASIFLHVIVLTYRWRVFGLRPAMFPGFRDLRNALVRLLHDIGFRAWPAQPKDQFVLQFRYFVIVTGVIILGVTGLILWNPLAVTSLLPGETIPISQSIHSDQALLTLAALILLQIGITFVWRAQPAAAPGPRRQFPNDLALRNRRYWTVAIPVATILVAALAWFLTSGDTAITTMPRRQAVVFAPQSMPAAGDAHIGAALWATLRCAFCHGTEAAGGSNGEPALRGTDLAFGAFYEQVRIGGEDMPAFSAEELPDAYVMHLWSWLTAPQEP